jgi:hypothetical protein
MPPLGLIGGWRTRPRCFSLDSGVEPVSLRIPKDSSRGSGLVESISVS